MKPELDAGYINGPIPGMSLTAEPGSRPWEMPSKYATIEEAIAYYSKRILGDTESHDGILDILETGLPVENAAAILNKTSVMNGIHNLEVGFLVLPVIEELIMTVADIYDVKYITSYEDIAKVNTVSAREARLAMQDIGQPKEDIKEEPAPVQPKGLMAKSTTVTGA